MSVAVIGLGFGDEGKGLVTDYLCSRLNPSRVVRFSGGHQAGHTVMCKGKRHVFSNYGSGTLRNIPTRWEADTIDPVGIMRELKSLNKIGIEPELSIDPLCSVTTPYDKIANIDDPITMKHGSCGVGFGKTIERENAGYQLLARDLLYPVALKIRFDIIKEYYGISIDPEKEEEFHAACRALKERVFIGSDYTATENVVYEGSQGLLLDKEWGFFPHVTRTKTDTSRVKGNLEKIYLVTRAYQTRHGNGPMTNTEHKHAIPINPFESNVTNEYQGEFRRSYLDVDLLKYAIVNNDDYDIVPENCVLVITCLDVIKDDYCYSFSQQLTKFNSEKAFVHTIKEILGFKKAIAVRSPLTEDVKE